MDCAELRSDIDKLEQELRVLEENIEAIRKEEEHNKELQAVARFVDSDAPDLLLEKYFEDFRVQNPEFFPVITLGERVDVVDASGGLATYIESVVATDDGRVLIGGSNGVLYVGSYNEWGELELGERIDISDAKGEPVVIRSIATVDDEHVLIGGSGGELHVGSYGAGLEALKQHLPEIIKKDVRG